ncbi:hypothetical protein ACWEOE_11150 [Amycolatopsis sp. NPDC004368]
MTRRRGALLDSRSCVEENWSRELGAAGIADPHALIPQLAVRYDGGLAGSKAAKNAEPVRLARAMAERLLAGAERA